MSMELTKNRIKFIVSLYQKKNRDAQSCFIGEGSKLLFDLLPYFRVHSLVCTKEWYNDNRKELDKYECGDLIVLDDSRAMSKISQLSTPSSVLCVFYKKETIQVEDVLINSDLVLALDSIQDPGNLGTIIRTADWFGIRYIFCSGETVDVYNSKVVQSTMGAISRVDVLYGDITNFLSSCIECGKEVYGTFLEGTNIYRTELSNRDTVLLMGNEGKGISEDASRYVSCKLNIPTYPIGAENSESLNVAIATSIALSEIRRR